MKTHYYSKERNTQIVISLLKAHGIRKIIASPGATNIGFVASVQIDSYFEVYSCVDERSAAYMACGMAAESGEPVVISCTGATSSRNYMPGLTEAFYRKLPILAITSSRGENLIGHLKPQVTDRENLPSDIVVEHVTAPLVVDKITENLCTINVNKALLALTRAGGGPAHINLMTLTPSDFSVRNIEPVRAIHRYSIGDDLPILPDGKIVVFVGSHKIFTKEEVSAIDSFCRNYNAVVLYDHTSGYFGECGVLASLIMCQEKVSDLLSKIDLLIHIGEVSGCYYLARMKPKIVWRVNEDGEIRDFFGTLTSVFEMKETFFFNNYLLNKVANKNKLLEDCQSEYNKIFAKIPELPFSNLWIAQQSSVLLPKNSVIHLGILNSLRSWNFFQFDSTIVSDCNVGGFGIDGIVSTIIGASLASPSKLHFCVLGDLAFFYDMNALGNRHISKNIRILVVNNGLGQEFRNPSFENSYSLGDDTNLYIAAEGHYGHKSKELIRNYVQSLGFEYLSATNKVDFIKQSVRFFKGDFLDKPIVFEVFTDSEQEAEALNMICNIVVAPQDNPINKIKKGIKNSISEDKLQALRTLLK
jgi:2-succinyl-5-enolpyruvyl-6-hydroxy-3-cyclohexene-1-carboxylate synthase